jgi:hypothetical protein
MQTFLPSASFQKSSKILDNKRLCKQRIEAYQILCVLLEGKKAWSTHPAVLMWKGYEGYLCEYLDAIMLEWTMRGFRNDKMEKNRLTLGIRFLERLILSYNKPPWLGNRKFHASHRSNLLRKNKTYYKQFRWKERNNLPYIWPSKSIVTTSSNSACFPQ